MSYIQNKALKDLATKLKEKDPIKEKRNIKNFNFSLNNVCFLTSKLSRNKKTEYILLKDLKNNGYINENQKYSSKCNDKIKKDINFRINTKDDGKKEIYIKCIVNYDKFIENIKNNFIKESKFEKAEKVFENSIKYKSNKLNGKNLEFDIKILPNSINKVMYTENGEFLFDLQFPPIFRTNFLIDDTGIDANNLNYEDIVFPFRNFKDEIANLKYRHFYILLKKDFNNAHKSTIENMKHYLGNLFINKNNIIDSKKFQFISEIKITTEYEIKKNNYKEGKYELSDYFKFKSDSKIYEILKKLKFIRNEQQDEIYYNDTCFDNESKANENKKNNKKLPIDEEVIKLNYQILALVSVEILSYYNAIEFVENILFQKNKDYRSTIFALSTDEDYPTFFNLTLTKILNDLQNSFEELDLETFESILETTFKAIYSEYFIKGMKETLKPSKNSLLRFIQRCVITPTYILFTPYILDQGNRIVRDFLPSSNQSMICCFKMDNCEGGRWNNKFLIEYIKYVLSNGFYIGEQNFKFFNYSQSQFEICLVGY